MKRILVLAAVLASPAIADEGHSHPDIHTPLGFKWSPDRRADGLSFVIRDNGHVIVFAPAGSYFDRDAREMGSSIAWRWSGPDGPFQDGNCLYESPNGNSVCEPDLYALQDGIFDHPTDPALGRSFNHVELPGHFPDFSSLTTDELLEHLWIGGTTRSLARTPQGVKILPDDEFVVGTGPWLVTREPPQVPEPGIGALMLIALAAWARMTAGRLTPSQ